jgi:hypothetical protein
MQREVPPVHMRHDVEPREVLLAPAPDTLVELEFQLVPLPQHAGEIRVGLNFQFSKKGWLDKTFAKTTAVLYWL